MQKYELESLDSHIPTDDYISEAKLLRGYIYIALDKAFPEFCKIGKTGNSTKRMLRYNSDKPYPSTYIHAISKEFVNADLVEEKILKYLYSVTSPTTFKRGWFLIEHLSLIESLIQKAETYYELVNE